MRGKINAGFVQMHGVSCLSPAPSVSPLANCFALEAAGSLSAQRTIYVSEMSMKTSHLQRTIFLLKKDISYCVRQLNRTKCCSGSAPVYTKTGFIIAKETCDISAEHFYVCKSR